MSSTPNFERVRKTLLLQGEPDRVPVMEQTVDRDVKKAFLGRPIQGLEDDVEFWMTAGYDYICLPCGIRTALLTAGGNTGTGVRDTDIDRSMRSIKAPYSVIEDEERERKWAEEGTGIIAGQAEFEAFRWPEAQAINYSDIERVRDYLPTGAKAFVSIGYIYATVTRLMGFQNFCEKQIEEPDLVARIFEKVGQIQLQVFEHVVRMEWVGGIWHPDDVAYVSGTMVSPRFLREHLWPWYREMGRTCRELGKPMVYHSDGKVTPVLDDIVETGFTTLHPIEPKPVDIVEVKRKYGDKLSLIGNIDLAYTLTRGTPEEVDAEVRERIRMVAPGGGYAVGSANSVTEYVPLANFNAMREATFKYGRYPIAL